MSRRKLIGTVKVYVTEYPKLNCATYETVWPRKLYDRAHGYPRVLRNRRGSRTVVAWGKP